MHPIYMFRSKMLLIVLLLAGLPVASPRLALGADASTQIAHSEGDADANTHDLVQGSHVEGHIAFLKAELVITADQEPLWIPVAAAMREDVSNLQEAERKTDQKRRPNDAVAYLENRVLFANLRAQGETRFLNAFRPLYSSLSQPQKQTADSLLIPNTSE